MTIFYLPIYAAMGKSYWFWRAFPVMWLFSQLMFLKKILWQLDLLLTLVIAVQYGGKRCLHVLRKNLHKLLLTGLSKGPTQGSFPSLKPTVQQGWLRSAHSGCWWGGGILFVLRGSFSIWMQIEILAHLLIVSCLSGLPLGPIVWSPSFTDFLHQSSWPTETHQPDLGQSPTLPAYLQHRLSEK